MNRTRTGALTLAVVCAMTIVAGLGRPGTGIQAQGQQAPGRTLGTVTTQGDLIVMTLNEGALGTANQFDLVGRTLRFTPGAGGYRAENIALEWDAELGAEMTGAQVALKNFMFPFSGKAWDAFSVGTTGSIAFGGAPAAAGAPAGGGGRGGGVSIGRFDQLQQAARTLVNTVPALCVFMKPRMSGTRHVKELADRVVVSWSLTEPAAGIQDFTWVPTINRFQAVLRKDGSVDFSYRELAAKDAIVGLYPVVNAGAEKPLVAVTDSREAAIPGHLDATSVKVGVVDGLFLKVTLETREAVLPEGDAGLSGVTYRIAFDANAVTAATADAARATAVWTIAGAAGGRGGRGGGGATPSTRYSASGEGVEPAVTVSGRTISVRGILPPALQAGSKISVFVETAAGATAPVDRVAPKALTLTGIQRPNADLSALKKTDGPFPVLYESFHYLALPVARDLTCTVIKALGDKFDFLAYYSDFRVDNQEAGTPSTGPLGGGPDGGAVTGIGATQRSLESYCTNGRFQWQFVQPVYANSNQMQAYPPADITDTNQRNVLGYREQLARRSPDGRIPAYNYGLSQIAHEMGHRWSAFVSARVGTETIPLGPTHWARGLQAPVPFPFQRPSEASAMGGGVWQDNLDGTYTQLDDDYYVPATGWSYLDLYLMGLISPSEVPDFFILRNLVAAGRDANGRPTFRADRTKVTIQDVIAVEGPRQPDVTKSQKKFNTGMVVIVEHGRTPSPEIVERANGIARAWVDYWAVTTGFRSSMTTSVR